MYSIVLTDGKIVNINATQVEWNKWNRGDRIAIFRNGRKKIVARINMDNVAGWIETNYKVKSEG